MCCSYEIISRESARGVRLKNGFEIPTYEIETAAFSDLRNWMPARLNHPEERTQDFARGGNQVKELIVNDRKDPFPRYILN